MEERRKRKKVRGKSAEKTNKRQDRKGKKTRQKKERGDRKGESNGSPEIPDRRVKDIHGLPSGLFKKARIS